MLIAVYFLPLAVGDIGYFSLPPQ